MTQSLAAAAADFEFPADENIDFDALVAEVDAPDPMIARRMLLDIARDTLSMEHVQSLRSQIVERYDERTSELAARIADRRRALEAYVVRFGPVKFPDAGGAHLTTKCKGGTIKCVDAVALEDFLLTCAEIEVPYKPAALDAAAALEAVRKKFKVHATPEGKLVSHETGEVVEIPGIAVEPEGKSLAVRKP